MPEIQELIQKKMEAFARQQEKGTIYEPVRYILGLGGKRLRPALSLMACRLFTDELHDAIHPALAVEVFHNFTLMHDDIMDNAPLRRGKATVHEKWNTNTAILSGDAMMIKSYELLAKTRPEIFPHIYRIFNKTALEVCEGQHMDMSFESRNDVSMPEYLEMIRLKTSVLLAGAMQIGAAVGGASAQDQEHIYRFGECTGIAFQLLDDLLDVFGESEKVGKMKGGDIASDKKTYLLIHALEIADEASKEVLLYWLGKKPKDPTEKIKAITGIFERLSVKEALLQKVQYYHYQALLELKALNADEERKRPLAVLAGQMLERQH